MGTQVRVTPEGLRISRRVVTSKVRHAGPPDAGAADERIGRARPPSMIPAEAPALVWRNVRLSMHPLLE